MDRRSGARMLVPPALFLIVLAILGVYQNDLLTTLGLAALTQAQVDMRYALQVGIWLSAAYFVNRLVQVFVWEGIIHRALGFRPPRLLRDVTAAFIYLIALTGILNFVFGRSVAGIWATSGVAGLVLGLALRNIILDVFIGLAVNLEQPFRIGEFISVGPNLFGRVIEINWRTTRIETGENNTVIVPNSNIGTMTITNFSRPDSRAEFELILVFDFSVTPDRVLRVLSAGVMSVVGDGILEDPEPKARIKGVADNGIEYKVKYTIDCARVGPGKARHRVLEGLLHELHQAGITPANAKQDVYYAPMPQRDLDTRSLADRMQLLSRVELLAGLDEGDLEMLALDVSQRRFLANGTVITQNEPGESMFIVIEGLLHVNIDFNNDGKQTRVGRVRAGEFFGEMSLLTGEARSATVVAATDSLVYELTKPDMEAIFSRRPEVAEQMSHVVAKRHLANDAAYKRATAMQQAQQESSLAKHIMARIRSFFSVVFTAGSTAPPQNGDSASDANVDAEALAINAHG